MILFRDLTLKNLALTAISMLSVLTALIAFFFGIALNVFV